MRDANKAVQTQTPDWAAAGRFIGRVTDVVPIKTSPEAEVVSCQFDGQPAILKRFATSSATRTIDRMQKELRLLAPRMSTGPYQVNRLLGCWSDVGIVALSRAGGIHLSKAINRADPAARGDLFCRAGRWAMVYGEDRRDISQFAPRFWLRRLKAQDFTRFTTDADKARLSGAIAGLGRIADQTHGCDVTKAACHGDFVGINIFADGDVLCGVDTQGESRLPLARDIARFLAWQQAIHPDPMAPDRYGINRTDLSALLSSGVLAPAETDTTLRFFLWDQLLGRYGARLGGQGPGAALSLALDRWIDQAK